MRDHYSRVLFWPRSFSSAREEEGGRREQERRNKSDPTPPCCTQTDPNQYHDSFFPTCPKSYTRAMQPSCQSRPLAPFSQPGGGIAIQCLSHGAGNLMHCNGHDGHSPTTLPHTHLVKCNVPYVLFPIPSRLSSPQPTCLDRATTTCAPEGGPRPSASIKSGQESATPAQ